MKASMCSLSCLTEVKDAPCSDFACRIENQISTCLSQEARVGVKWNCTFGYSLSQRSLLGLWVLRLSSTTWMAVSGQAATMSFMFEEFDAAPALLVSRRHLAGGHLEGGKQCRGAIALVIVTMTAQCTAVRELQIALRTLQRLDRGLFVDADDNRVLGRRHVEPDYVGGLGYERGILALAPRFASARSIFWPRRKRQTYWTSTSPSAAARSGPDQRPYPFGGG